MHEFSRATLGRKSRRFKWCVIKNVQSRMCTVPTVYNLCADAQRIPGHAPAPKPAGADAVLMPLKIRL